MYLQIGYGQSTVEPINSSVSTESGNFSRNTYDIDDATAGRFAVGWTLPDGRGRFLLSFEGIKEDGFKFDAVGEQTSARAPDGGSVPDDYAPITPVPWWYVTVRDGVLSTRKDVPIWDSETSDCVIGCDRNDDGEFSFDELDYNNENFPDEGAASRGVTNSLNNTVKTYDFTYNREFGGRRIWGDWSAGGRYFTYGGAVPMAAWILVAGGVPGDGYTDGVADGLVTLRQDASGYGPTGSAGVNFGFFRRKLVLHAGARASFLLTSLEVNSGGFETLYEVIGDDYGRAPASLSRSLDKSSWQLQADVAVRWEVAPGLTLMLDYRRHGFQDVIIVPLELNIPDNFSQVPEPGSLRAGEGTSAIFRTTDFRAQTLMAGLSFQF